MATTKITDLTAYTDPVNTDVLPIVDVTSDVTKKVSIANVMKNASQGTAAAPGIAFDGDSNTGIYSPGANQVAITTDGTQRLLIDSAGAVTIAGDLTVNGTTTNINTQNLIVEDKNVVLGDVAVPTDVTADGGGITLKGTTDKTINWVDATDAWTSSEHINIASGKEYRIAGTKVLDATSLGSSVLITSANITDGTIVNGDINASAAIAGTKISPDFGSQNVTTTGTVTGASLIPTSSTAPTNGVYLPAADQVAISTGGSGRLFITNGGNVGVGVSSPQGKLTVSNSGAEGIEFNPGYASGLSSILAYNRTTSAHTELGFEATQFPFRISGTERMRLDSSGRLGVGTSSPSQLLTLQQTSAGSAVDCLFLNNSSISNGTAVGISFGPNTTNDITRSAIIRGINESGGSGNATGLGFFTNANGSIPTERARIDSSGRVGIGYSSPSYTLDVNGTARFNGNTVVNGSGFDINPASGLPNISLRSGNTYRGYIEGNASGGITIGSGPAATTAMTIDSSQRVGIGTTSPEDRLDLGSGYLRFKEAVGGTGTYGAIRAFNTLANTNPATSIRFIRDVANVGNDGAICFDTVNSERARIDSSGRLLVGTSSASAAATSVLVQGNGSSSTAEGIIRLTRGTTTPGASDELGTIAFGDSNHNTAAYLACNRDGGTWNTSTSRPTRLVFSTTADGASSPTEHFRITQRGIFKFSTNGSYIDTGSAYNEIYQTNSSVGLLITNTNASPQGFQINYNTDSNGTGNEFIYCQGGATQRMTVRSNGGIANYSANNVNLCDEREKKNIETLDSTWGCLKNWELKKFHYNEDADTDDKRYGVIAQQVALHCPEVITEWVKQKAEDAVLDEDGNVVTPVVEEVTRMGVKEQQMYWMAIKALQEAQVRIEQLEAKVAALESA